MHCPFKNLAFGRRLVDKQEEQYFMYIFHRELSIHDLGGKQSQFF